MGTVTWSSSLREKLLENSYLYPEFLQNLCPHIAEK